MNPSLRIVTTIPLQEVWLPDGAITKSRKRSLSAEDIREMLRLGPQRLVVADVGLPLKWIPIGECFRFWKTEVSSHLAPPDIRVALRDFPGNYCYFASEWAAPEGASSLLVLEVNH